MLTPRVHRALRLTLQLEHLKQRRATLDRKIQVLGAKLAQVQANLRGGEPEEYRRQVAEAGVNSSAPDRLPPSSSAGHRSRMICNEEA